MFKSLENGYAFAALPLRLGLGALFIYMGIFNIMDTAGTTAQMSAIGFPAPMVFAMIIMISQLVCGAFIILIPEYDFSIERVCELVQGGRRAGARYEILVVAEGAKPSGRSEFVARDEVDGFGHKALGGIAEFLATEIQKATKIDSRSVVLSHLQRGGAPCAYDRRMGRYFGIAAVDLVVREDFGKMVSCRNGKITAVPLEEATGP